MNILCLMHTYSVCSAYAVFFPVRSQCTQLWSGSAIQEQCICSSAAIISALFQVYFRCAVPCWIKVTAQCSHYTRIHMKM